MVPSQTFSLDLTFLWRWRVADLFLSLFYPWPSLCAVKRLNNGHTLQNTALKRHLGSMKRKQRANEDSEVDGEIDYRVFAEAECITLCPRDW